MKKTETISRTNINYPKDKFTKAEVKAFLDKMEDGDEIAIHIDYEGYYSENNSWDPHTEILITRDRDETEEEKAYRLEQVKLNEKAMWERRKAQYEKLKKEFENESGN